MVAATSSKGKGVYNNFLYLLRFVVYIAPPVVRRTMAACQPNASHILLYQEAFIAAIVTNASEEISQLLFAWKGSMMTLTELLRNGVHCER